MSKPLRILGIAGSLRRQSYNRAALRAATQLAPDLALQVAAEVGGHPVVVEQGVIHVEEEDYVARLHRKSPRV